MSNVDIKELFEAGAHFGHKTSRWHPKMATYIHSVKGDQHIINLDKTVVLLEEAMQALESITAAGKQVLFVGTKRQAEKPILRAADATGMPYVTVRWMGGLLTNYKTMNDRVKHLKKLEERMASGELASRYNKLEVQRFQEEIDALNHNFGGIKDLRGTPGAVVVVDVTNEKIAIQEARRLGVPVVGIVDSNADPSDIDYPIPANDDSIKAVELIVGHLANAVNDGKAKVKQAPVKKEAVRAVPGSATKPAPGKSKDEAKTKPAAEKKEPAKKSDEKPKKKETAKEEK